jgi:hypothetical protein
MVSPTRGAAEADPRAGPRVSAPRNTAISVRRSAARTSASLEAPSFRILQNANRFGAFERLGGGHEQTAAPYEGRLTHPPRFDREDTRCGALEDRRALGIELR